MQPHDPLLNVPLSPAQEAAEKRVHQTLVILWAAMLVSVLIYFAIIQVLSPEFVSSGEENPLLETVLLGIAIGLVGASFPIRNSMLAKSRVARHRDRLAELTGDRPAGSGQLPRGQGLLQAALIVPLAMCEAAGIFGVVVFFTTGSAQYYIFLAIALVGMVLHFPRRHY